MIIKNKLLEIKTLEYSLENEYYNVKLNMKLANDITDTDFTIVYYAKFSNRDLNYLSENICDMLNNKIGSFGFKSCDNSLSIFLEQSNDGLIAQVEIWKKESSIKYKLFIKVEYLLMEQVYNYICSIKEKSINIRKNFQSDGVDTLQIKISKSDFADYYSLSLYIVEDRIIRKRCLLQDDIELLKLQIQDLLKGNIQSVNIENDNLFLSIFAFGTEFLVDGVIRDFSFPSNNMVKILSGNRIKPSAIEKIIR